MTLIYSYFEWENFLMSYTIVCFPYDQPIKLKNEPYNMSH
uniref:Uncharacterized protein n=1 Tax=Anguilla anguilla TaxID=7936 RepID=A0A0E9SBH9_ANGAN